MKGFLYIAGIFLLVASVSSFPRSLRALCNSDDPHSISSKCDPAPADDEILVRKTVIVPGAFLKVKTKTITFPESGPGAETISCIRVTDLLQNGHGGCPSFESGGEQFHDVTIKFISQLSQDMKFLVEIYGKV